MKYITLILFAATFTASAADNQTIHCQLGEAVRIIEVVYPQGGELPCEVQYSKDGATSVLWQANNETGYCEQKAAEFAEKQRGWGWQCVTTTSAKAASETP